MKKKDQAPSSGTAREVVPAESAGASAVEAAGYFGVTDATAKQALHEVKARIQGFQRKGLELIINIGNELIGAQGILDGSVYEWASTELGIGDSTVHNYMAVAKQFTDSPKIPTVGLLPLRTVYALATHTVPAAAVDEVLERVEAGNRPDYEEVKQVIARYRQAEKQAANPEVASSHATPAASSGQVRAEAVPASSSSEETSGTLVAAQLPTAEPLPVEPTAPAQVATPSVPILDALNSILEVGPQEFRALERNQLATAIATFEALLKVARDVQLEPDDLLAAV